MDLYIIRTTFQAYIAEKIICERKESNNYILYIAANSKKNQTYSFNRLKPFSHESQFILLPDSTNIFANLINHVKIFIKISHMKQFRARYKNVYLSSIDSVIIQTILSKIYFTNLYTFDDGTANYNKDGIYYNSIKHSYLRDISMLFGNRYSIERIKKESKEHYAILPEEENIINNIIPIKFDTKTSLQLLSNNNISCAVLLGSVFNVISTNPKLLIDDINKKMGFIDFYIPHPREMNSNIFYEKRNQKESVAEIIIEDLLKKYKKVIVYAFNSTSILTLSRYERVELRLLSHKTIEKRFLFQYLSTFAQVYEI